MSGADDPRLLSVAANIADGTAIDWNNIAQQVDDPEQSPILDELRALERLKALGEMTPPQWGTFLIKTEIGRGAFGRVYHGFDPHLQIDIAVKVVRGDASTPAVDVSRAFTEARLLAKVSHPNVVRVYRAERIGDEVGIAMELIRGRTLNAIVHDTGRFGAGEAAVIGIDLCRALAAVHAAGVLHGDIKAHNVMRESGGRTILMDFGAGRMLDLAVHTGRDFAGTPVYLAPEVFDGVARSTATDIYSLGVLLHYLVTGSYPVEGATSSEVARRHRQQAPRKNLRDVRPDLPDGFIRVVEQALAPASEHRFHSVGALESALAETVVSPEPSPNRWRLVLAAAAVMLALALGGYRMWPSRPAGSPAPGVADTNAAAAGAYRIEAALYVERGGADIRVQQGMRVAPGDKLSLHVRSSVPAHVYVVNEDEQGAGYLLFPLPGQSLTNPLPAQALHRLPGTQEGERLSWQVTSAGGREHFIIFANTAPLTSFDQLFASLSRPVQDSPVQAVSLPKEAIGVLRGVGGVTSTPAAPGAPLGLARDFTTPLVNGEESVRGVWIRQVTLENPVR